MFKIKVCADLVVFLFVILFAICAVTVISLRSCLGRQFSVGGPALLQQRIASMFSLNDALKFTIEFLGKLVPCEEVVLQQLRTGRSVICIQLKTTLNRSSKHFFMYVLYIYVYICIHEYIGI